MTATDSRGGFRESFSNYYTVSDDDTVGPVITVNGGSYVDGSTNNEVAADDQFFQWSIIDDKSGSTSAVTIAKNGNQIFSTAYASDVASDQFDFNDYGVGSYTISINALDNDKDQQDGDQEPSSAVIVVNVTNAAPLAAFQIDTLEIDRLEGSPLTFDASGSSDPEGDALQYVWNFGDGTLERGVTASHVYADNGVYPVVLTVVDEFGGIATVSQSVTNQNVAPTLTASSPAGVSETSLFNLELLAFDPGDDETTYLVDWGDGATDSYTSGGTKSHAYTNGGLQHTLRVTLSDEDGIYPDLYVTQVTVENTAPILEGFLAFVSAEANQTIDWNVNVIDGAGDTHTFVWDFGDLATVSGAGLESVQHSYANDGTYPLSLTVTDSDGLSTQETATVVIGAPVSFSSSGQTVDESVGAITVAAELTHGLPLDHDVTINLAISGDVTDADYDLPVAQIVIPQGQLAGSTVINIFDDVRDEDMEQLRVVMVSTTGASQGAVREHVIEIQDNDERPVVFFTTPSQSITEDVGVVTLTATLSRASGRDVIVPIAFSGSATAGADYGVPAPASILIPAGETSGTFDLTITDDNAIEPAEMIVVSMLPSPQAELSSAVGQPIVVSAIIAPSDAPDVSLDSAYRITTEDTSTFFITARLSRFSDELITVPIALSGTAENGVDYRIVNALLEFFPGSAEASIQINIVDDTIAEGVETIVVELLSAVNANLGTTQLTVTEILDNDIVRVSFEPGDISQFEGHTVSVTVRLSKPSSTTVVIPLLLSGSATRNSDYSISSPELFVIPVINHHSLVLTPGANGLTAQEATIQISLVDNNINEFTETLYLTLGNTITGGFLGDVVTKKISIKDNDPLVSMILPSNSKYVEDNVSIAFGVELSAPTDEAITVPIRFSGTARRGSDFNAPTSVTIPQGAISATFHVSILEDVLAESTENILVALGTPSAGILASPTKSNLLIEDDEVFVNWATRYHSSDEADGAQTFTIFLAQPTTEDVTVNLAYASEGRTVTYKQTFFEGTFFEKTINLSYITGKADQGSDYEAVATSVVIPAGQTSVSFEVPVIDDYVKESAEIITIRMNSASNALLPVEASQRKLTFTITDVDELTAAEDLAFDSALRGYDSKDLLGVNIEQKLAVNFDNDRAQEDAAGALLFAIEEAAKFIPGPTGCITQGVAHAIKWTQEQYPDGAEVDYERLKGDMKKGICWKILARELGVFYAKSAAWAFATGGTTCTGPGGLPWLSALGDAALEAAGDYYRENEEKVNRSADEKIGQPVTEWVKANDDGYVAAKENVGSYAAARNPFSSGGYIANGTIYFDANFNGVLDELELPGTTTGDGHALITNIASADKNNDGQLGIDEGQWVSVAGIDTSIDQKIKIPFVAPASFSAITPTSTLIATMLNRGGFEQTPAGLQLAETRFFESISSPVFDIAHLDILGAAADGDVLSAALFAKETQYYNTVIAVASMFDALETGLPFEHLSSLVFDDLADKISSPGSSLNLTNSLVVKSVIQGVSIRSGIVIDAGVAAAVADVLARSSQIIDQETPEGSEAFLEGVVKAHKFVQSDLVLEIADLVRGNISVSTFSNNNSDLASRIQGAQTFDILPVYLVVEDATMTEGSDGASSVLTFTVSPTGTSGPPCLRFVQHGRPHGCGWRGLRER